MVRSPYGVAILACATATFRPLLLNCETGKRQQRSG
jgi:hypothetical protein